MASYFSCQSIGNAVLEKLIQEECPIVEADQVLSNEQQPLMTVEELNALRYAAGYIIRALERSFRSQPIH